MPFLNYIIQIVISIIIILLIHYLYNYFKDTYTTKKTRNMYEIHQNKYNEIFEIIKQGQETQKINEQEQNELMKYVLEDRIDLEETDFKDLEEIHL